MDQNDILYEKSETLYDKIEGESTRFGNMLARIPGLRGYIHAERRREADRLLRQTLTAPLAQVRLQLGDVQQGMSGDIVKAIRYAEKIGRLDTRLMGLIGKIHDAPTGYSGFFSAIKIGAEELEKIYHFDEQMLQHVDLISASGAALQKAAKSDGEIASALDELQTALTNAQLAWNERGTVLQGLA